MNREKILNTIGFTLLAVCFLFSLGRIVLSKARNSGGAGGEGVITLRLAHWQLEGGVRDALNVLAKRYQELNPRVQVQQIPIPERIYTNWLITQLTGGTPPDIIELGSTVTPERLARYFIPLSNLAAEPNPYNAGTPLEGVPLRETFFDGMEGGFDETLLEYFGVPISSFAIRMFYNLDLLKEITGSDKMPQTFEEFQKLCEQTVAYSKRTGKAIYPLAGSKATGPRLLGVLFEGQTQKLLQDRVNRPGTVSSIPNAAFIADAYGRGDWSLNSPEILSGLQLMRDFGKYMQPGFMQLGRDDATFYFAQGRALMICTGTWDATSLRQASPFPLGASLVPVPTPRTEGFGKYTFGFTSEASQNAGLKFGITKASKHPREAENFLQFIASVPGNKIWTDVSKWPPAIVGVEAPEDARIFTPITEGYMPGFNITKPGADTNRVVSTNVNMLFTSDGSPEAFVKAIEPSYKRYLLSDLKRVVRVNTDNLRRSDTLLGVLGYLAEPGTPEAKKLDTLIQVSVGNEGLYYQYIGALAHQKP